MPHPVDDLHRHLGRTGPLRAAEAREHLGVSQSTFSRTVAGSRGRILQVGRARATHYAARRSVEGLAETVPVYEVGPPGVPPRRLSTLHPVLPRGWLAEGPGIGPAWFDDLPWFLYDIAPAGFLGRLVPRRHPDLGLPADILLWSADHVLRWASRYGWDLPGALVVGEEAFRQFVEHTATPPDPVAAADRERVYGELAADVLSHGVPGSSAAGEQPKFLATRSQGEALVPVLVKFSPPVIGPESRRTADLLVCEHLVHQVLARRGHPVARSELVRGGGRVFLEVERFDRAGTRHRRGVLSLLALDAEYVGSDLSSWSGTTARLLDQGRISEEDHRLVRWRECYGRLVGNTDMHLGNISFFCRGLDLEGVAPAYDVSPTLYAVQAGQVVPRELRPAAPGPEEGDVWEEALGAAEETWEAIAGDARVSDDFRAVARANAASLKGRCGLVDLLPR